MGVPTGEGRFANRNPFKNPLGEIKRIVDIQIRRGRRPKERFGRFPLHIGRPNIVTKDSHGNPLGGVSRNTRRVKRTAFCNSL